MTAPLLKRLRCAIYTRKSHEEGLEQAFNSLDAQREAGVAYIASQKHEGWDLLPQQYDDGGYSGGTIERPALQRLLSDIRNKKIDVIIVYKVDRLSRSIHDFAQMMTLFDQHEVSFVSVTQQFNTTTSMGRLTLNILLSFAQFEREVTGERIRDKFAASKKKGMWMGGRPPLGYRIQDRLLLIDETEVELVNKIFNGYLQSRSLVQLSETLIAEGHTTKRWLCASGRWMGGGKITPGYLNHILRNAIYAGKVVHKKEHYEGQHTAIIDESLWNKVQEAIQHRETYSRHRWQSFFLLKGKIKTYEGFTMSPSSSYRSKHRNKTPIKKQVHYYVSRKCITQGYKNCVIKNLNAKRLDELVLNHLLDYLQNHNKDANERLNSIEEEETKKYWQRQLIDGVVVWPEKLVITIDKVQIATLMKEIPESTNTNKVTKLKINPEKKVWHQAAIQDEADKAILTLGIMIKRENGRRLMLAPDGTDLIMPAQPKVDPAILTALGRAFGWRQMLDNDRNLSLRKLARQCGIHDRFLAKRLLLNTLAPDIVHRALSGTLPTSVNLTRLHEAAEHLSWPHQRQMLGLN